MTIWTTSPAGTDTAPGAYGGRQTTLRTGQRYSYSDCAGDATQYVKLVPYNDTTYMVVFDNHYFHRRSSSLLSRPMLYTLTTDEIESGGNVILV